MSIPDPDPKPKIAWDLIIFESVTAPVMAFLALGCVFSWLDRSAALALPIGVEVWLAALVPAVTLIGVTALHVLRHRKARR